MLKVIFVGGCKRGYKLIKEIEDMVQFQYIFIFKQDDHEMERYEQTIKSFAEKNNIPYKITKSINKKEYKEIIEKLDSDLMIIFGWRTMIAKDIYSLPKKGAIALHHSLLPKYRGFAPGNWAIINGEKESGVTLFYLSEKVDKGDIVAQKKIPIEFTDTIKDFMENVTSGSIELLKEYLPLIEKGIAPRTKQDNSKATYMPRRNPEDGLIDWNKETIEIYNWVRALTYPSTGAFTYHHNKKIYVWEACIPKNSLNYVGRIPGSIVSIKNEGVEVLTGDGSIILKKIQVEDSDMLLASEYFKSIKDRLGK